jgi:hypothetical protein
MARNDNFFLERWIRYYSQEIGSENLYVLLDGLEQEAPANARDAFVSWVEHKQLPRLAGDKHRINLINKRAQQLFAQGYDYVIGTDADEFLVVDPQLNMGLAEFITRHGKHASMSALGLDLGQRVGEEEALDASRSILQQRRYAVLCDRYTKASVLCKRGMSWGSGFHRVKRRNFFIVPGLYLIHTGYCDLGKVRQRMGDTDRINAAWEAHLDRRARTITLTSENTPLEGERWLSKARRLQTLCRKIYAFNKPHMPGKVKVIQLPERFQKIDL